MNTSFGKFISLFFLILFLLFNNISSAQIEFEVLSFEEKPFDQRARINKKQNFSGENCAIIAIVTDLSDLGFHGDVIDADYNQQGEWLIWVSPGTNSITISKIGFLPLEYNFPNEIRIESLKVYELKLTRKTDFVVEDLYDLSFSFNVAGVYISRDFLGAVETDGYNTSYLLPRKQYRFNFQCKGFESMDTVINLQDDMSVEITFERGDSDIKNKITCHISTEPNEARIFLNGQDKGLSSKTITLLPGNHLIRLEKKYYKTIIDSINITKGTSIPYKLTSWFGHLQLNVKPENAVIELNNKDYKNGEKRKLECKYHYIRITHNTHETYYDSILINNEDDIKKDISMNPLGGYINITSQPNNAIVFIDEDSVGKTPFYSKWLKSAEYEIKLIADYDKEYKEYKWGPNIFDVKISNGETVKKFVELYKYYARLTIISNKSDILINKEKAGFDSLAIELPPDKIFNISAEKYKHKNDVLPVQLEKGENRRIELKPIPRTGTIHVWGDPYDVTEGAEIWIKGRKQNEVLPANLELLYGEYFLTIKCPMCLDQTELIEIVEDVELEKEIDMICIEDSAEIVEKIHKKRFILSFIPPAGIGHFYGANGGKGFLYFTTNTAAIMSALYFYDSYIKLSNQYIELNKEITNTVRMDQKIPLLEEQRTLASKINNTYMWRNISYGIPVFLYALNITDAYFTKKNDKKFNRINKKFAKKKNNSKLSLYPVNGCLMLGFNYSF